MTATPTEPNPEEGASPVAVAVWETTVQTLDETARLGQWWGTQVQRGDLLDLRGTLGTGKTTFTRDLGRALGVIETLSSPTFVICRRHDGRLPLFHIDAYRLEDPTELIVQGWDEMLQEGVVVVEWGDRIPELLPKDRVIVTLEHRGESCRYLRFEGTGERSGARVASLRAAPLG